MANIKSQIKRIKVSEKQRMRNKQVRSMIKTYVTRLNEVEEGNLVEGEKALKSAIKVIDSAVSKGVMHINTAANKKAAIQKRFNGMVAKSSEAPSEVKEVKAPKAVKKTRTTKSTTAKKTTKTTKKTAKKAGRATKVISD